MPEIKLSGVDITGILVKTFNYNIDVSASGNYYGSFGLTDGYEEVGVGYTWSPVNPGDHIHFNILTMTLGTSWNFDAEGPGNLIISVRGVKGLEYYGQTLVNP